MNIKRKVLPPTMPNYIVVETESVSKQEGFNFESGTINIVDLTEEQAIEYGELMKNTFIEHWRKRRHVRSV